MPFSIGSQGNGLVFYAEVRFLLFFQVVLQWGQGGGGEGDGGCKREWLVKLTVRSFLFYLYVIFIVILLFKGLLSMNML